MTGSTALTQPSRGIGGASRGPHATPYLAIAGERGRRGGRACAPPLSWGNNDLNTGGGDDGGGGENLAVGAADGVAGAAADNCGVRRVDRRCSGRSADRTGRREGGSGSGGGGGEDRFKWGEILSRACAISWNNGALDDRRRDDRAVTNRDPGQMKSPFRLCNLAIPDSP